jgi:hypothetical protein
VLPTEGYAKMDPPPGGGGGGGMGGGGGPVAAHRRVCDDGPTPRVRWLVLVNLLVAVHGGANGGPGAGGGARRPVSIEHTHTLVQYNG